VEKYGKEIQATENNKIRHMALHGRYYKQILRIYNIYFFSLVTIIA
jgi:hypothetical protein